MPKTLTTPLSDAVIKRYLKSPGVYQLKDPRYSLYLRYNQARTAGSWLLVHYAQGIQRRRKLAKFPHTPTKVLFKRLPEILAELAVNPDSDQLCLGEFDSVAALLNWYGERAETDRNLSKSRKANIKCVIKGQLIPVLGRFKVEALNHTRVDESLIWPAQALHSLSYVRLMLGVLKAAFKQARRLHRIETNPIKDLKLTDFVQTRAPVKPCAIRSERVDEIAAELEFHDTTTQALVVLMLAHGTRIGETRRATWNAIDLVSAEWLIPAEHTKTKQAHRLPLTPVMVEYLKAYRISQRHSGYVGVYLFPAKQKRDAMTATDANGRIQMMSEGDWTAHDLRKVARTVWADLGIDYMVGELLLNHALTKLDQTYIHTYAETQKRQALDKYHFWLKSNGFFLGLREATNPTPTQINSGPARSGMSVKVCSLNPLSTPEENKQ